ncbi:MAG: hypothetical protein A6D92_16355 [Symbiobacterium thermophilum]|uniref:Uncharacterized protein n=1 Tax=Symbiobacterium thermophilum TaxID=2734 RepID=A0A1Y2T209_SYMTR|nr:MAG: hypothetical protein A6D92_16355 [Symbiobacterium thermophilum]
MRTSQIACLAPGTFLAAMELSGGSSAAVTLVPRMSKTMLTAISSRTITKAIIACTRCSARFELQLTTTASRNESKPTRTARRHPGIGGGSFAMFARRS